MCVHNVHMHARLRACVYVCVCAVMMYQIFTHNIDLPTRTDCVFINFLFMYMCACNFSDM